jgi:hypothetical protein
MSPISLSLMELLGPKLPEEPEEELEIADPEFDPPSSEIGVRGGEASVEVNLRPSPNEPSRFCEKSKRGEE